MAAFLVTLFLPLAAMAVVDLSQPWAEAPGYNANNAATTLAAAVNSNTRSYLLLKGGKKVAEYYRPGVSETTTSEMWSTTKSWSSLLIGMLVDAGSVSVTSTLETIFPATTNWAAVTDQAAKKTLKLAELLTMTSGLKDPAGFPSQNSLVEVLNHGTYDASKVGTFQYLASTHILAYAIKHASGGVEPETYALGASGVFPALGITSGSFSWGADFLHLFDNAEGVSGSAFGLKMTVRQMAKLGQLYLQNGKASASNQLVSSAWVVQSTSWDTYWGELPGVCNSATEKLTGYGYQFWIYRSKRAGYADVDYYCAIGYNGQWICVYPSLDAVFVTASDQDAGGCALLGHIPQLLLDGADASLSSATSPSPPPPDDGPSSNGSDDSMTIILAAGGGGAAIALGALLVGYLLTSKGKASATKAATTMAAATSSSSTTASLSSAAISPSAPALPTAPRDVEMAAVPVMSVAPVAQTMGARFDPKTGQPIPKFDPATGKQNWFDDAPQGNRFDPKTGQPIPKFDPATGKQNWFEGPEA